MTSLQAATTRLIRLLVGVELLAVDVQLQVVRAVDEGLVTAVVGEFKRLRLGLRLLISI